MIKDLVSTKDLEKSDIENIFKLAGDSKSEKMGLEIPLKGKSIALVFQKPSNRTRVSFEVGMAQLGGHAIYLGPEDIKIGQREPTKDVARTLSRYLDGIVARTFSHRDIIELAKYATIPVINGLSDLEHPCQALSDVFTIKEKKGKLKDVNLVFVGDGNNVLNSLLYCCAKLGINLLISTPKDYSPDKGIVDEAMDIAKKTGSRIELSNDPRAFIKDADIVYTDVWVSMGEEAEREKRVRDFSAFQVNEELLRALKGRDFFVMHCLPAHRNEEITDAVMESKHSIVFDQAENRLHVQKALLLTLLSVKEAR